MFADAEVCPLMLPSLSGQMESQALREDEQRAQEQVRKNNEWLRLAGVFREESDQGFLFFPQGESCDIPLEQLLTVANMQRDIHGHFFNAFRFQHGSHASFRRTLRKRRSWPLEPIPLPSRFNTSGKKVERILERRLAKLHLPDWTVDWFRRMYAGVVTHAQRVIDLSQKYPDPRELFGEATGKDPTGRVEALAGPFAMHLRCEDPKDFLVLCEGDDDVEKWDDEKDGDDKFNLGVSTWYEFDAVDGKYVRVTAENVSEQPTPEDSVLTLDHEEIHAANAFFQHGTTCNAFRPHEKTPMQQCIGAAFDASVKDEVLAWSGERVDFPAIFAPKPKGVYNYLPRKKRKMRKLQVHADVIDQFSAAAPEYVKTLAETAEAVFLCLQNAGLEGGIIREMLRTTPLPHWPEVAERYGKRS